MAKDPRMSALEKVASMATSASGGVSGAVPKPPSPWKGAAKKARGAAGAAGRAIGGRAGAPIGTGMNADPRAGGPGAKARNTMRNAGRSIDNVGRGVR